MEQSQLIELIRTLNQAEKELILQLASLPYFNHGKMKVHVPALLELCLDQAWEDVQQGLDKKTIFLMLFPKQEFVEGKLDKIMAEAHKVIRTVLLMQRYLQEGNAFQQGFDFSEIVRVKGLDIRYKHLLSRLQKMHQENHFKNADYFQTQFLLEYKIHEHESFYNQKKGDLNVLNTLEALELHFHINRLALLNRLLLQEKIVKVEIPETKKHLLEIIEVPTLYLELSAVLKANHAIFQLLRKDHPEPNDIRTLFQLLQNDEEKLDHERLQEFYTYLRNICILVLSENHENTEIETTLHELYKDNLKRGYLHSHGKLLSSRYWAVSSNAIRVKDFNWAIEFIEKYKHELIGENETQDIYRLNMANYLFGLGKFSECLDFIPPSSPFVDYLLTGKRLEIKAYYELKSELLPYKLEAFKVFLSRTSPKLLSETQKQIHVDFANFLTQIHLSRPGDPKRAELLLKRIQEKKQSAEWRWLMEKARALKDK